MIDPIAAEIAKNALVYAIGRDGHRGAQQRVFAQHQGAARSLVRALRPARTADRAGRAHSGASRIAAVGAAAHARDRRGRARRRSRGRDVGRERSLYHRHASERRHGRASGLLPRPPRRLRGEQGAPCRRRRRGSRFDAVGREGSLRGGAGRAAAAARGERPRGSRNRRSLSRKLAHARRAQRRPARAGGGELYRRAAPAGALRALRIRRGRGCDRARARRQRAAHARRAARDRRRNLRCDGFPGRPRRRAQHRDRAALGTARWKRRAGLFGHVAASRIPAQRRLRRDAIRRALRAARRHGSYHSDERRVLSSRHGARAARVAAQSAPARAGFGRQRRDEHAQRRGRAAGARKGRAAARARLQRRDDEQRDAGRHAPQRRDAGRSTKPTAAAWARVRMPTASTASTAT